MVSRSGIGVGGEVCDELDCQSRTNGSREGAIVTKRYNRGVGFLRARICVVALWVIRRLPAWVSKDTGVIILGG